jgi:hypothetical protein
LIIELHDFEEVPHDPTMETICDPDSYSDTNRQGQEDFSHVSSYGVIAERLLPYAVVPLYDTCHQRHEP